MALAFGSVFNILTRRFVGADEVEGYDFRTVKENVKGRMRVLWEKVRVKVQGGGGAEMQKKVQ